MNEKKLIILKTALQLFYRKGIHAVGVNEVIKCSGVAKKTMYYHFESKEALVIEALKLRDIKFLSWLKSLFEQSDTGQKAIIDMFHGLDAWFNDKAEPLGDFRGCFFINASAEYREPNSPIYLECQAHKERVIELIKSQARRFISHPQTIENIAATLGILKEGCITSALVQNDKQAAVKVLPIVHSLILNPDMCV